MENVDLEGAVNSQRPRKEIETEYGRFMRHENGILYLHMYDDLTVDVPAAQQMVSAARVLDDSGQIRLIIVYGKNSDLTFNAQRYFSTVTGFSHLAFVTRSRLQVEVGQFLTTLLRVLKSAYEFRVFYDIASAEAWLLQQ